MPQGSNFENEMSFFQEEGVADVKALKMVI